MANLTRKPLIQSVLTICTI